MNLSDYTKAITAEDLIRRYNLDSLKTDRTAIEKLKTSVNGTNKIIEDYVKAVTKELGELQDQVDGNITTWFLNGVPTLENSPAIDWTTDDDKNNHLGDLYYDQDTGYAYRFALYDGVYSWLKITDSDVTKALGIANSAQDTADSKRRVFVETPIPPYDVGDIWIKEDKELYRCRATRKEGEYSEVDWILATDYTNDDYAKNVEAVLNQFQTEVATDYVTNVTLETTKDSILGVVEAETTEVKIISNNNYQDILAGLSQYETVENVTAVRQEVENLQTATNETIKVVEELKVNGTTQVVTETGYEFNKDGLNISKSGSPVGSSLDEAGLEIIDKTGANETTQFYGGYVTSELAEKTSELAKYEGQTVTYSKNLLFSQFLTSPNWRIEEIIDETYGVGLGFFYIGGNS